jgi:hypothetical protein
MNIIELSKRIDHYKTNVTSRSWTKIESAVYFSNEYISVKRLDSSNKWLGVPHASEMEKMWSIIVDLKKEIRTLPKYRELSRVIDIRLTPVKKGELAGCYDIRIYGMKREPTSTIIYDILNFIFS